jgi:hypothetical protein
MAGRSVVRRAALFPDRPPHTTGPPARTTIGTAPTASPAIVKKVLYLKTAKISCVCVSVVLFLSGGR